MGKETAIEIKEHGVSAIRSLYEVLSGSFISAALENLSPATHGRPFLIELRPEFHIFLTPSSTLA